MRYNKIRSLDISNGPGCRVSVFVQGCEIRCKGCFNQDLWNKNEGIEWTEQTTKLLLELINKDWIKGITWLGGEPSMYPKEIAELNKEIRERMPEKSIWLYTGLSPQTVKNTEKEELKALFDSCDAIVAGPFVEELRDINLQFMGSSNQEIVYRERK